VNTAAGEWQAFEHDIFAHPKIIDAMLKNSDGYKALSTLQPAAKAWQGLLKGLRKKAGVRLDMSLHAGLNGVG
jgi:hypothetical protein